MANTEILTHISAEMAKGVPVERIQQELLAQGHAPEDVNGAFAYLRLHTSVPMAGAFPEPYIMPIRTNARVPSFFALLVLVVGALALSYVMYGQMTGDSSIKSVRAMLLTDTSALFATLQSFSLPAFPSKAPQATPSEETAATTATVAATTSVEKNPPMPAPKDVPAPSAPVQPAPPRTVTSDYPPPQVLLSSSASSVSSGGVVTLTWQSVNAMSCEGTGFFASKPQGTATVQVTKTTTFSLVCKNGDASAASSVKVSVRLFSL
jgi:hypothetical protein